MDKSHSRGGVRHPASMQLLCAGLGALALGLTVPGCGGGDGDAPSASTRSAPLAQQAQQAQQATDPASELAMVLYYYSCPENMACNAEGAPNTTALVYPGGGTGNPADRSPSWSPDGMRLAFERAGEIYVQDIGAGTPAVNRTNHAALDTSPAWSPDGAKIAFVSDRGGRNELYVMDAAGGAPHLRLNSRLAGRASWSPDSKKLAYGCDYEPIGSDICVINADGSGLVRLTADAAPDGDPAWSPDGTTIVFSTGRFPGDGLNATLAAMNPDGSAVRALPIAGYQAAWSSDGSRLAFVVTEPCYSFAGCPNIYVFNVDGSALTWVAGGFEPAWRSAGAAPLPPPPPAQPPPPPPPPNQPPTLQPVANQTHRVGQSVALQLRASDADGDTLYYSVTGLPPGLERNTSTGLISGTPTTARSYDNVTVEVFDGRGGIARTTFTWTITPPPNQPPVLAPVGKQSHRVGQAVSLVLSASDPNGDALTFSAIRLPPGLSIGATIGVITGTPNKRGTFSVEAQVSDGRGGSAKRTFTWSITR